MDTSNENLFVIAPVENADSAPFGQQANRTPKEIVVQLVRGRLFEGNDLAASRIHSAHDGTDRAILTRGIHSLEDEQHGLPIVRIKNLLQLVERVDHLCQFLLAFLLARGFCGRRVRRILDIERPIE